MISTLTILLAGGVSKIKTSMIHSFSLRVYAAALGLALAILLFGSVGTVSAQVVNGSFETGDDPGIFSTRIPGDTDIANWTVTAGSIDYIGTYWQAAEGSRSIDMNGTEAGAISQTIPTVIGATYDVTFYISGNPDGGPALKEMAVGATGAAAQNYSYDTSAEGNTKADMKWSPRTYSFLATGASTVLTFESLVAGAYGPALDNITIVETLPPPPCDNCGCGGSGSHASGNAGGVNISVSQSGCINNTTSATASTGGNTAGGSEGGRGGRGGSVRANGGGILSPSIGNNGGATGGAGGAGGAGAEGGFIQTGPANANASTTNILNRLRIRINL